MFMTCLQVSVPKKCQFFISVYILPFNSRGFLLPKEAYSIYRFILLTLGDAGNEMRCQG